MYCIYSPTFHLGICIVTDTNTTSKWSVYHKSNHSSGLQVGPDLTYVCVDGFTSEHKGTRPCYPTVYGNELETNQEKKLQHRHVKKMK